MPNSIGFILIPIIAIVLALFVTGVFTDRYALPALTGFAVLVGFGSYYLAQGDPRLGRALNGSLLIWILLVGVYNHLESRQDFPRLAALDELVARNTTVKDLPIVASDEVLYLQWVHYFRPDVASRLVCVGNGRQNRGLKKRLGAFRPIVVLRLEDYSSFTTSHRRFFLLSRDHFFGRWIRQALVEDGAHLEPIGQVAGDSLFLVTFAPRSP